MRLGLACAMLTHLKKLHETRLFNMRSCAFTEPTLKEEATLNYMRSMESFLKYVRTRDLTEFIYITRLTCFVVVLQVESVGRKKRMKIFYYFFSVTKFIFTNNFS